MKTLKAMFMASVLGLSVMASSGAQALTINKFDKLESGQQSQIISDTLTQLASNLSTNRKLPPARREVLTTCMVSDFTTVPVGSNLSVPPAMTVFALAMAQQREKGVSNSVHVEHVIQVVFSSWLNNKCVKDKPIPTAQ